MVDGWLQQIVDIDGVEGVIVCSNRGDIIEKKGDAFEHRKLQQIAVHILRVISSHYIKKRTLKEIEVIWDNFHIMVKNSTQFVMITFCRSAQVLSLLRITLNVVFAHLLEDKKFMKEVNKHVLEKTVVLRKGNLDETEINLISKLQ